MPVAANITLRDESASEQSPNNWKSIGELARKLAENAKAGAQ